jgi:long-chain acyl-CoA synthetase
MIEESLFGWLTHHARNNPTQSCISVADGGRNVDYRQALELAEQIAAFLHAHDLCGRSRVVVFAAAGNHWVFLLLLAACLRSGVTLLPLDPDLHPDEVSAVLEKARPDLIITDSPVDSTYGSIDRVTIAELVRAIEGSFEQQCNCGPGGGGRTAHLLIHTSGSSGNAKLVMLTESALVADASRVADRYHLSVDDRFYCVLPFHHMNATMITGCVPLVAGASIVLGPLFGANNATRFWPSVQAANVSIISLVPSILSVLLLLQSTRPCSGATALRFAFCGAAPLAADLWRRFEDGFGLPVFQGYGLTETTCWAVTTPPEGHRDYKSVGTPLPGCEIAIEVDPTGEVLFGDRHLAAERASSGTAYVMGEVLVRGPVLMTGYLGQKKATAKVLRADGYLRTGDVGYVDPQGRLHIVARKKDIIIKNGRNIVPSEIDAVLSRHPAVAECRTVGLPHELVGEQVVSAVRFTRDAQVDVAELRRFARAELAPYKRPDRFVPVGVLPKTSTGKIAVAELRERLDGTAVETRVRALNTWRYKRAQPSDVEALRAALSRAVLWGEDVSFVAYWGCGRRARTNATDRLAMDRMCEYVAHATCASAGSRLTWVLTDVHARINGKPADRTAGYFESVIDDARRRQVRTVYLSELWTSIGRRLDDLAPAERDDPLLGRALARSIKHVERGDAELAARRYITACRWDSAAVSACYREAIFLTYNGPADAMFLPALPSLYLYSYRKGVSAKPWFCDEPVSAGAGRLRP